MMFHICRKVLVKLSSSFYITSKIHKTRRKMKTESIVLPLQIRNVETVTKINIIYLLNIISNKRNDPRDAVYFPPYKTLNQSNRCFPQNLLLILFKTLNKILREVGHREIMKDKEMSLERFHYSGQSC